MYTMFLCLAKTMVRDSFCLVIVFSDPAALDGVGEALLCRFLTNNKLIYTLPTQHVYNAVKSIITQL